MSTSFIIILIICGIGYYLYVSLVQKKNKAKEALSGIDVQLKKRADLIPNILKIAQKFMEHEKELLTDITELRAQVTKDYDREQKAEVEEHLKAAEMLAGKMGKLMIAVEDYPDLKSDQTMVQAQQTYNEVEEHIAASRRFYNSAVTELNNAVEIFPSSVIAKMIKISDMPFYEADEASKAPVDADQYLK